MNAEDQHTSGHLSPRFLILLSVKFALIIVMGVAEVAWIWLFAPVGLPLLFAAVGVAALLIADGRTRDDGQGAGRKLTPGLASIFPPAADMTGCIIGIGADSQASPTHTHPPKPEEVAAP